MSQRRKINALTYFSLLGLLLVGGMLGHASNDGESNAGERLENELEELSTSLKELSATVNALASEKASAARAKAEKETKQSLTALEAKLDTLSKDIEANTSKIKNKSQQHAADMAKSLSAGIKQLTQKLSSSDKPDQ